MKKFLIAGLRTHRDRLALRVLLLRHHRGDGERLEEARLDVQLRDILHLQLRPRLEDLVQVVRQVLVDRLHELQEVVHLCRRNGLIKGTDAKG